MKHIWAFHGSVERICLPVQETQVRSWVERCFGVGMATHSSNTDWKKSPWTKETEGCNSFSLKELDTTEQLSAHTHTQYLKRIRKKGYLSTYTHTHTMQNISYSPTWFTCLFKCDVNDFRYSKQCYSVSAFFPSTTCIYLWGLCLEDKFHIEHHVFTHLMSF